MKRLKVFLAAGLLTALLTVIGCAAFPTANNGNADRIQALEAELQQTKEEKYANEQAYYKEISALKEELARLTENKSPEGGTSLVFHYKVEEGAATVTGYEGTAALVHIPSTLDGYPVRKIGERAFEGNTSLAAVVVPEGVLEIDWFAFYGCASLQEITLPDSVQVVGHAVFDGCNDLSVICGKESYAKDYAYSYGLHVIIR